MKTQKRQKSKQPRENLSATAISAPESVVGNDRNAHAESPSQNKQNSQQPQDQAANQSPTGKFRWFVRFFRGTDIPTWHIVYATWIIALTSIVLGWCQTCQYKETTHTDLRAYIAAINPCDDIIAIVTGSKRDTTYEQIAWISVVNFGKTPAMNVSPRQAFARLKRDSQDFEPDADLVRNNLRFMIAPGETLRIPIRPWVGHWIEAAGNEKQIFGIVTYTDHANVSHRTLFAYQWENISQSYRRMAKFNYGD